MKENEKGELINYYNLLHKGNEYVEIKYNNKETVTVNSADEFIKNIGYLLDNNVKQIWSTPNGSTNEVNDYFTDDIIDTSYCLIADFDFSNSEHKSDNQIYADCEQFKNEHLTRLNDIGFYPSIIVHSGGGVHLYWIIDDNLGHLSNTEYSNLCEKAYQVGFAEETRYVTFNECANKSRCLRVPFTPNPKHNKNAEIVKINDNVYSLDYTNSLFDRENIKVKSVQKAKSKQKRYINQIENDPKFKWMTNPDDNTKLNGKGTYNNDRSRKDQAICWYLLVNSWSDKEIHAIYEKYMNHEGHKYFEKGNQRTNYLQTTLDNIDRKDIEIRIKQSSADFIKDNGEPDKRKIIEYVYNNTSLYTDNVLQLYSTTRLWNDVLWIVADDKAKQKLVFNHFKNEYGLYLEPAEYKKFVEILSMIDINHLNHTDYLARYQNVVPWVFNNGTFYYYPKDGGHEFKEGVFEKDDIALFKLKIDYDKSMWSGDWRKGGLFEQTVTRFYDDKAVEALQYTLVSVLVPNYQPDKVLFIVGPQNTGKTTIINLFSSLLSDGAMSVTDLSKVGERFQLSLMENSILNLTIEKKEGDKIPVDKLKYLTGGEQMIETEHKREQKRNVKLLCKHIVITNEMPEIRYDGALKRRFMFGLTQNPITETERDTNFRINFERDQKINMMRFLFDGLRKLGENNFQAPTGHAGIYEAFAREGDNYTRFVYDVFEPCGADQYVTSSHVFESFKIWNDYNNPDHGKIDGQNKISSEFKRACENLSYDIEDSRKYIQIRNKKVQTRIFEGLRLKEKWFNTLSNRSVTDIEIYQDFYTQHSIDELFVVNS